MASSLVHMSMHATPLTDQTLNISLVSTNIPPLEPSTSTLPFSYLRGSRALSTSHLDRHLCKDDRARLQHYGLPRQIDPFHRSECWPPIELYNGLTTGSYRWKLKADFASEKVRVIVVTDMAAYGFDVPNVRRVVTTDLEEMEQKFGCAGRDGQPAEAIAFAP
jgi:hypothetical protein